MSLKKLLASAAAAFLVLFISFGLSHGEGYPPVDQKRAPLVLKSHGIFWAGGQIVNRTQSGTQNAGDLKNVPYHQQQYLVGQAYVEYFVPLKLRNGKSPCRS